jgi:hypothetical protein
MALRLSPAPSGTRPGNASEKWYSTGCHSFTGIVHRSWAFMSARYKTFSSEASLGKAPRLRVTLRSWDCIDSIAFVV